MTLLKHNRHRHAGFSLIEFLVIISLLGTFMLVASQVFNQSMFLSRQARQGEEAVGQVQYAMRLLRADVWNASTIHTPADDRLVLDESGAHAVTWTIYEPDIDDPMEPPVMLVRSARSADGALDERELVLPESMVFEVNQAGVVVRMADQEALLVSQMLLAKELP